MQYQEITIAAGQHETPQGATADKAEARDALEEAIFLMCEALGVLAHNTGDNDLAALTDVTVTSLDRMSGEELSHRGAAVLARANAHKTDLQPLQVTQANIDELTETLADFNAARTGPRTATAERAALTKSLTKLVRELLDILRKKVDRMVNLFKRTHPDFVAGYETARVIVDRAATHKTKPMPATPNP